MSSFNSPQQYNVDPPPGPDAQPPPYQPQQPPQGYAPQPGGPPPGAPGGGQPPFQPPGGYAPMPPQGPQPRRRGPIILATLLSVALVAAIGVFVFFKFVWTSGPDPAEQFPSSASMYLEVNFDPSFDQTPKLIEHLNKFEGLDYDDTNDILSDLLEESGLEGVDAEDDIASWLGRRHGMAMWTHDDQPYAVVNLASTDAEAAEAGLEKLRNASEVEDDQWAYSVGDDSVLMVAGEEGAAEALEAAESEAGSSPLSSSESYEEARSWLDDDQLAVYWFDVNALTETAGLMGGEEGVAELESMFAGHFIAGVSAFDDGFELSYRHFGDEENPWTGSEDLLADMGEMPASDIAVSADVPENLAEITEEWTSDIEELAGEGETETSGEPLTAAEYEEYLALDEQWWDDTLAPEDEERYAELEERYWAYGTEEDPTGYEDDYGSGIGEGLDAAQEIIDLLSGSRLALAADFPAEGGEFDPETLFASIVLADDRAEELSAMIDEMSNGEALPDGVEVDGSELSYQGGNVADGTLADDDRFSDFADAAPDSNAFGVWADLSEVASYEEFSGAEPLSAFAWAQGSVDGDGTGLARLYLK